MKSFCQYLAEMSVERATKIVTGLAHDVKTLGIMTPTNPQAEKFPNRMNNLFVSQFLDQLRSNGYEPIRIGGQFGGNKEESFLIKNISRQEIINLGKEYNQESVIWGKKTKEPNGVPHFRYEYIDNGKTSMTSDELHLNGNVQNQQDNFSTIKGRKFVIPFN